MGDLAPAHWEISSRDIPRPCTTPRCPPASRQGRQDEQWHGGKCPWAWRSFSLRLASSFHGVSSPCGGCVPLSWAIQQHDANYGEHQHAEADDSIDEPIRNRLHLAARIGRPGLATDTRTDTRNDGHRWQ